MTHIDAEKLRLSDGRIAVVGYTGFVGSNICRQLQVDSHFNSSNIQEIAGQEFDIVIAAANYAEMWRINQHPDEDRKNIEIFLDNLSDAKIERLILISTISVYDTHEFVDEDHAIARSSSAYGENRLQLEAVVSENFNATIIRLPALFGRGLKKNALFDLIHDNRIDQLNPDSSYQYYNLEWIGQHIATVISNGISLVNLMTPPITNRELAKIISARRQLNGQQDGPIAKWNLRTKYSQLFGGIPGYICSRDHLNSELKRFAERQQS